MQRAQGLGCGGVLAVGVVWVLVGGAIGFTAANWVALALVIAIGAGIAFAFRDEHRIASGKAFEPPPEPGADEDEEALSPELRRLMRGK